MPAIAVPSLLRKSTTVRMEVDGTLQVTCKPCEAHHDQAEFVTSLLGPDRSVFLGGGEFGTRAFVLTEILGNMKWYARPGSHQHTIITVTPDQRCVVRTSGYISDKQRERMGIKFQVAASLSPAQARERIARWAEGDYVEEPAYAKHNVESGGMGMLAQRAYSEGSMALTFFPDDVRITRRGETLQRFEYSIELTMGRTQPSPQATQPSHEGVVRSFFPHVVRGTP